ncbi:MAG: glycosyltransferase [Deltaproteobacteria bacterium]|nr:glycosyltransferase [Deltaproteobacteria bacterium]
MRKKRDKLSTCVITIDPLHRGGVYALVKVMYQALEELGLNPSLYFLSLKDRFSLRRRGFSNQLMQGRSIGFIPFTEYLQYIPPALVSSEELKQFEIFIVVGGFNACALIPLLNRKRFVCWIATMVADEWRARLSYAPNDLFRSWSLLSNMILLPINTALERYIFSKASYVHSISSYTKQQIEQKCGKAGNIGILNYPVDTELFHPASECGKSTRERYIFAAGRIGDARKNFPFLLRAFATVLRSCPYLKLVIATGEIPSNSSDIKKLASKLGIADSVKFLGRLSQKQMAEYHRSAQVFALSSKQEGLGIVILEAMASGVPVVSTCCGGPEAILKKSGAGFLVPQDNEILFAEKLLQLLEKSELRYQMGQKAIAYVLQNHSMEDFKSTIVKTYQIVYPEYQF